MKKEIQPCKRISLLYIHCHPQIIVQTKTQKEQQPKLQNSTDLIYVTNIYRISYTPTSKCTVLSGTHIVSLRYIILQDTEHNLTSIKVNIFCVLSFHNGKRNRNQQKRKTLKLYKHMGIGQYTFKRLKIKAWDKTLSSQN